MIYYKKSIKHSYDTIVKTLEAKYQAYEFI